jgi:hypothetical protein
MGTIGEIAAMEFRRIVGRHAKHGVFVLALVTVLLIWVDQVRPLSTRG